MNTSNKEKINYYIELYFKYKRNTNFGKLLFDLQFIFHIKYCKELL